MIGLDMAFSGYEWLERQLEAMHASPRRCRASKIVSPLGRMVADVLGYAWRGLYHMPEATIIRTNWHDPHRVVSRARAMSTWDHDELSRVVIASFDLLLRLEIEPINQQWLGLAFSRRSARTGSVMESLPYLEDVITQVRRGYTVLREPQEKTA